MKDYGFDMDAVRKSIEKNKHNHFSTCYNLLLKRYMRETGITNIQHNFKKRIEENK